MSSRKRRSIGYGHVPGAGRIPLYEPGLEDSDSGATGAPDTSFPSRQELRKVRILPNTISLVRDGGSAFFEGKAGTRKLRFHYDGRVGSVTRGQLFVDDRPIGAQECAALAAAIGEQIRCPIAGDDVQDLALVLARVAIERHY
jgi:hypothetical protein